MWLVILFIVLLIAAALIYTLRAPPLPEGVPTIPAYPLLGCFFRLPKVKKGKNVFDWHMNWTRKLKSKTIAYSFFGGPAPVLATTDPKVIEYVLSGNFDNFAKGGTFRERFKDLLGNGIFNTDGSEWRQQRKLASHIFSISNFKLSMMSIFLHHAHTFSSILDATVNSSTASTISSSYYSHFNFNDRKVNFHDSNSGDSNNGDSVDGSSSDDGFSQQQVRQEQQQIFRDRRQQRIGREEESKDYVDLQQLFFRYTLACFAQSAFGVDIKAMEEEPPFAASFDVALSVMSSRVKVPFWWLTEKFSQNGADMRSAMNTINEFAYCVIQARRQHIETDLSAREENDLLGHFLQHKDENGEPFSDEYLRDVVMNFILAGRNATAGALTALMWEVAQHPEVEEKMVAEMQETFGDKEPTYSDLFKLTYTQAVISEALRLHPPLPLSGKTALSDDILPGGIKVKKGTHCIYLAYAMGRDPDLWENPLKFDPERFVKRPAANVSMYEYPVFNAGQRTCLGINLAPLKIKALLSVILPKFTFRLAPGASDIPVYPALTVTFKDGLPVRVIRRKK